MNTIQLSLDMSRNKNIKKYFKGVLPSDGLPKQIKKPAMIIVNTDPSHKPGTHWTAFYLPKHGKPEYFDSIGRSPNLKEFLIFLKKHGKSFMRNKRRLQGAFSTTCGQYCGVYLYFRSRGMSFEEFLKLFSDNHVENDEKVMKLYQKIFGKNKKVQVGGNLIICNQTCQPCQE